jgi:hypothetical protein
MIPVRVKMLRNSLLMADEEMYSFKAGKCYDMQFGYAEDLHILLVPVEYGRFARGFLSRWEYGIDYIFIGRVWMKLTVRVIKFGEVVLTSDSKYIVAFRGNRFAIDRISLLDGPAKRYDVTGTELKQLFKRKLITFENEAVNRQITK